MFPFPRSVSRRTGSGQSNTSQRARATTSTSADSDKWFHDSVLNTPTQAREQSKDDSDDEVSSSLVSEPGSPPDVSMESGDEDMGGTFSQSPEDTLPGRPSRSSPWGQRLQMNRVPTPMVPMRPGASPERIRTGINQHIRRRHPQQNHPSSDYLEVPSPIDEDEVPTPPSAAEAAGSQLSMLSVSDMDMEQNDGSIPTISIEPARFVNHSSGTGLANEFESAVDLEPMDSGPDNIIVRKQRQRSGALSNGNSPVRAGSSIMSGKRGFSMGFRPDCEKCQMRVPGHMNHFIT